MKPLIAAILVLCLTIAVVADETLYRYEGDVHPLDLSAGWVMGDPCEPPSSEFLEDGHFVRLWSEADDFANYHLWIAVTPTPPPDAVGRVALPVQLSAGTDSRRLRCRGQPLASERVRRRPPLWRFDHYL